MVTQLLSSWFSERERDRLTNTTTPSPTYQWCSTKPVLQMAVCFLFQALIMLHGNK